MNIMLGLGLYAVSATMAAFMGRTHESLKFSQFFTSCKHEVLGANFRRVGTGGAVIYVAYCNQLPIGSGLVSIWIDEWQGGAGDLFYPEQQVGDENLFPPQIGNQETCWLDKTKYDSNKFWECFKYKRKNIL